MALGAWSGGKLWELLIRDTQGMGPDVPPYPRFPSGQRGPLLHSSC